jgi:excisionase family DNA binding protein
VIETTKEAPRTISVEQAGAMLGIGRGLAYELAKRGELPGVLKLGGRYVVSRQRLEQTLAGPAQNEHHAAA